MSDSDRSLRIAVVGAGVSGLVSAAILSARHHVDLFESASHVGGHTRTLDVTIDGQSLPVDIGFMVFNRRTYRLFCRLLELLRIPCRTSNMSFSVACERSGVVYQGSSWNGLFARRTNALRPRFYRMLVDILRFHHQAAQRDDTSRTGETTATLQEFLTRHRFSEEFRDLYLVPMTAAIWSTDQDRVLEMPARFLLEFFRNHGLAQLRDRPVWYTIPGGARRYVDALLAHGLMHVHTDCPVQAIERHETHVALQTRQGWQPYDAVVLALPADAAFSVLVDPSPDERRLLGAITYQENRAVLHTDGRYLPQPARAAASWNFRAARDSSRTTVTYWINRLQGLQSSRPLLVTLNPHQPISASHVLHETTFRHPVFDVQAWQAQAALPTIQGQRRTYHCGAFWANGFHEDGVRSAVQVAQQFGLDWEACIAACMKGTCGTGAGRP